MSKFFDLDRFILLIHDFLPALSCVILINFLSKIYKLSSYWIPSLPAFCEKRKKHKLLHLQSNFYNILTNNNSTVAVNVLKKNINYYNSLYKSKQAYSLKRNAFLILFVMLIRDIKICIFLNVLMKKATVLKSTITIKIGSFQKMKNIKKVTSNLSLAKKIMKNLRINFIWFLSYNSIKSLFLKFIKTYNTTKNTININNCYENFF